MSIAIAMHDSLDVAELWCRVDEVTEEGDICFWVINGNWEGMLFPETGHLIVKNSGQRFRAQKVWEGDAPFTPTQYNEALQWINEKIKEKNEV